MDYKYRGNYGAELGIDRLKVSFVFIGSIQVIMRMTREEELPVAGYV